jgi:two-component system, OmpR family, heavy metal sensor histidine kinase CusS
VNSISQRLSLQIALLTMVVLGAVFAASWWSVSMLMKERSRDELDFRTQILVQSIAGAAKSGGGEAAILRKMEQVASMRPGTLLEVYRSDGTLLYADAKVPEHSLSAHVQERRFRVDAPGVPGNAVNARLVVDFEDNARMGRRWAWILFVATIVGGTIVAAGAWWRVRRELLPLKQLAAQTQRISADRLDQRLALPEVAEELQPWIGQFNALMDRLQAAIEQLDAFNADVAHEMRTPIAALMGHIEVSLSRERPAGELRETMALSLEELQKLSALVDDMLFLSHADRGARARRAAPRSLRALAEQVLEYHEITFEDAGVVARVTGDAQAGVDDALIRRALSNLLSNAARYADKGSTVQVRIEPQAGKDSARIVVENRGTPIEPQLLPRLFDRFFRADRARSACQQHHGLGLAIVAAVARMHGGCTLAESNDGVTRIGFELCCDGGAGAAPPGEPVASARDVLTLGSESPRPASAH